MIVEYWLIFSTPRSFFGKILKKGFGHVSLITRDKYNWLMVDPLFNWVNLCIPPINVTDDFPVIYREKICPDCKIIYVKKQQETKQYFYPRFGFLSCVSLIKGIVGIKSLAITPYGLYRYLMRMEKYPQEYEDIKYIIDIREV